MTYTDYKQLCGSLEHYPARAELMYRYGMKKVEIDDVNLAKQSDEDYVKPGLRGEHDERIVYWLRSEPLLKIVGAQELVMNSDLSEYADFRDSEPLNGFIYSEIESSLSIEGVRSTRARIEELHRIDYDILTDQNDIIVKNMLLGFDFVRKHDITEQNIHQLYRILSNRCLNPGDELPEGLIYRNDAVQIVDVAGAVVDRGVDRTRIPDMIGDLLAYIDRDKTYEEHLVASHVIHYYFIYIHPYFDYNGRMARMLSFWYNVKHAPSLTLLFVSEAIRNKVNKAGYYAAIANSRTMENDITYFVEYAADVILDYTKVYINYYTLLRRIKSAGKQLRRSEEIALKHVLAMPGTEGYFDWKDFRDFAGESYSKVHCLNLLNALLDLRILSAVDRKKAKLFRLERDAWWLM
ncbi:MAG: Fic family protein [Candidatus Izemoplasmatales bacterium]